MFMQRYNPKEIEPKWQKIWDETGAYTTDLNSSRPKYMAMSMFNYPSGAGIHIGHALNYCVISSRISQNGVNFFALYIIAGSFAVSWLKYEADG